MRMASNNYNPYQYPYQHSTAQHYSTYQTAQASNNTVQSSRQYQQPSTSQAQDYMSYQPQSYANQGSGYGSGQGSTWNSSNYGGARETTSRAAEVLHNMSNNAYTPNTTVATNQSGFTTTGTTSSRYATDASNSPQVQAQSHATQSSYNQSQARPRSVNANRTQITASRGLPAPAITARYPSQRAQALYNQPTQRSASPAQPQYTPTTSVRSAATTAAANQPYNGYTQRQLPIVEASRNTTTSNSYYTNSQVTSAPTAPSAATASVAETYTGHGSTTVDPLAVYDPWPEYQRKQDALRAQKAVEESHRAEEERLTEEARKAEEEERKRKEEAEKLRQPKPKVKKTQQQQPAAPEAVPVAPELSEGPGEALETEIRAMMAKMRELNSKDPALLARIWEEERRAKAPGKSPAPTTSTPPATVPQPAEAMQTSTPPVANSRKKKTASRETANTTVAKAAMPVPASAVPARAKAQAVPKPGGNTIWPPDKKVYLANAAAAYLTAHNPDHPLEATLLLNMLDSNPSYIDLCERLERMGVKLDRAAFAKNLLTAVPDVNSASRKAAPQPTPVAVHRAQVPPAVLKKDVAVPTAGSPRHTPSVALPTNRRSYPPFPENGSPVATPALVAEMVPIRPELKPPANKEEAARKRNLSDLVDLTLLSDEEDMGPPRKRPNSNFMYSSGLASPHMQDGMIVDKEPTIKNFPVASVPAHPPQAPVARPTIPELRSRLYVNQLEKKKALRRNNYNPATIARDVLLACGRHPSERQLNQHLDSLRTTLPQISFESDLSTLRWDLIDPGKPPPGYFKDNVLNLTQDADDESSDEEGKEMYPQALSSTIGGESGAQARAQALPEPSNPFIKQKRRGRPPRHSLPNFNSPTTPTRSPSSAAMSVSAPRPSSEAAGVGYSAFRSVTGYGPDGQPLPKKKGRPVGWRKAIHGSAAAQTRPSGNRHTGPLAHHQPPQPSTLRNVRTGEEEPIRTDSRSPSVANRVQYQSYKCRWQKCNAELHNLETLKKHIFKVHRKETPDNTLECLWGNCGIEVTNHDPITNMRIERHEPYSFDLESLWHRHIQENHIDLLSWELGDGPASGLSDANESEAYLSDAQGRQVTPRITVDRERFQAHNSTTHDAAAVPRGRGRPPKNASEQEAYDAQARLVSHKKRIGGPGMDRGGATLVNDKRRKGFNDSIGPEDELVDAED